MAWINVAGQRFQIDLAKVRHDHGTQGKHSNYLKLRFLMLDVSNLKLSFWYFWRTDEASFPLIEFKNRTVLLKPLLAENVMHDVCL